MEIVGETRTLDIYEFIYLAFGLFIPESFLGECVSTRRSAPREVLEAYPVPPKVGDGSLRTRGPDVRRIPRPKTFLPFSIRASVSRLTGQNGVYCI